MKKLIKKPLLTSGFHAYQPHMAQLIYIWGSFARIPFIWRRGYSYLKQSYIRNALLDSELTQYFRSGAQLPNNYGRGIDERCIEYPWFFAKASSEAKEYLDAGSTLNNQFLLSSPFWKEKQLTILTLSPEPKCYCNLGISYQFSDLRRLPFRDHWFDEIACLSTLEHVGMNNFLYSKSQHHRETHTEDFKKALLELRRVLKPGGNLLFSVPFGSYQNWGIFQQFDKNLLEKAAAIFNPSQRVDTWYRYSSDGWQIEDYQNCQNCSYSEFIVKTWTSRFKMPAVESDFATGARAVACCIWQAH